MIWAAVGPAQRGRRAACCATLTAALRCLPPLPAPVQLLGLRSQRKPAGFWDNEANLGEWGGSDRGVVCITVVCITAWLA